MEIVLENDYVTPGQAEGSSECLYCDTQTLWEEDLFQITEQGQEFINITETLVL